MTAPHLRADLRQIRNWVPHQSHVLDLGCGDGALLQALVEEKQCTGYGVEIDTEALITAMARGINLIQADLEEGLRRFEDGQFDTVILSQTLQAVRNTEAILQEMSRVGREVIVSFPNFAYWPNRLQISLLGRMPVSERMPYAWYNTPNIHWCTLNDFEALCQKNGLTIRERALMCAGKTIRFWPNMRASLAFYRVGR